jgi:hypothetical protein
MHYSNFLFYDASLIATEFGKWAVEGLHDIYILYMIPCSSSWSDEMTTTEVQNHAMPLQVHR